LHNFLTSQPDLNFHSEEVQQAILGTVKFWLDLGIDGFRLDTANFYVHDKQLRANPPRGMPDGSDPAVTKVNPYAWQWHKFDKSQPENLAFMRRLRTLLDQYPGTTTVGEIGDDDGLARMAEYTRGNDHLHMAYCFDLLGENHKARYLHQVLSRYENEAADSWASWALANHDIPRLASRWGGAQPDPRLLRLSAALQMTLRGSPSIYQGDELGLTEASLRFEELQDPYGITMWPEFKGRDGCRTPMPWSGAQAHAGFTKGKPWLPVATEHLPLAADAQASDAGSLLNFYRHLLRWRKTQPALVHGSMQVLDGHDQVVAYTRSQAGQSLLCVFNFSDTVASWEIPDGLRTATVLNNSLLQGAQVVGHHVELQPWCGLLASV
jgi:alpha-glucosidase